MAVKPHGLANRPGEPYPATFHLPWTHRESNSDFRHARAVSSRWTMSPFAFSGPAGESNPDLLGANEASSRWTSRPCFLSEVRLGIEPSLPPYQSGVQPQHLQTKVFPHCSDPGWNRTITFLVVTQAPLPLDHGIMSVTEVGVEPTRTRLSTSLLCQFAYPVMSQ